MFALKKKCCSILMLLCFLVVLFPSSAFATETDHVHSWSNTWTASDTHHWHACTSAGCTVVSETQCSGYAMHDFSQYQYRCIVCEYSSAHEHYGGYATCEYNAICEGCGTIYGSTNSTNHQIPEGFGEKIDDSSHKIICSCGYVFVVSEPHNFTSWSKNSDGSEERWCEDCFYVQSRCAQHTHSYSQATCISAAVCSCGKTVGEKNPSNHTGGTETRDYVAATDNAEGYTGDIYCKGCGVKISAGESIPVQNVVDIIIDEDAGVRNITFQISEGTDIPEDSSLVVKNAEIGLSSIFSLVEHESSIPEYHFGSSVLDDAIYTHNDGTEYRSGEIIMIDGQRYCIGKYSGNGALLPVISLSDGMMLEYNMTKLQFEDTDGVQIQLRQVDNDIVNIDGVLYDVPISYTNSDGSQIEVLYHEGIPAGYINEGLIWLYEDRTPETVPTKGSRYLGTVTPGDKLVDFGLSYGTEYDTYLIGANDIQLLSGSGDPIWISSGDNYELGTLTQSFDLDTIGLSTELLTSSETCYVAIHFSEDDMSNLNIMDMDFGDVTLSSDGIKLGVTYSVYHFSPFVVYAFSKAQEPAVKVITSNTPEASDNGADNVFDSMESDNNKLWIRIGIIVSVLAVVTLVLCYLRRFGVFDKIKQRKKVCRKYRK